MVIAWTSFAVQTCTIRSTDKAFNMIPLITRVFKMASNNITHAGITRSLKSGFIIIKTCRTVTTEQIIFKVLFAFHTRYRPIVQQSACC